MDTTSLKFNGQVKLVNNAKELYNSINECIDKIVLSRLHQDVKAEEYAVFQAETLLCQVQQYLSNIIDYFIIMTRKEQIYFEIDKRKSRADCPFDYEDGFKRGVEWADEHPDSKHIYTKQQLIDMGFAFTTNGDIVPPDQLNEDLKKYLEYQKRKFIEKGKEWIEKNFRSDGYFSLYYLGCAIYTPENIAKDFCKAKEK